MTPISVNIGGTYREMSDGWVNINGTWRKVDSVFNNVGGVWKEGYKSGSYVAITTKGIVYHSSDLMSWTRGVTIGTIGYPSGNVADSVYSAFNKTNNVIVAVRANGSNYYYRSVDGGLTFTKIASSGYMPNVSCLEDRFVYTDGTTVYHSVDGLTWSSFNCGYEYTDGHYFRGLWIYNDYDSVYTNGSRLYFSQTMDSTRTSSGHTFYRSNYTVSAVGNYLYIAAGEGGTTDNDINFWYSTNGAMPVHIREVDGNSDSQPLRHYFQYKGNTIGYEAIVADPRVYYGYDTVITYFTASLYSGLSYTFDRDIKLTVVNDIIVSSARTATTRKLEMCISTAYPPSFTKYEHSLYYIDDDGGFRDIYYFKG